MSDPNALFFVHILRSTGLLRSKYLVRAKGHMEAEHKIQSLADKERKAGEPIFFPEVDDTISSEPVEFDNDLVQV